MKKVWALTRADWLNLWRTSKIFFGMILLYEVVYILAGEEWMFLSILSVALGGGFSPIRPSGTTSGAGGTGLS